MSIRKIYPAIKELLDAPPKKLVLSGPSGFLGSKVLDTILEVHKLREENNEEPGQVILLTSSPGGLMGRLSKTYGVDKMKTVQASRVDYYSQHNPRTWRDHLGSLGLEGSGAVFVNLAAVAGPTPGKRDPMMDVNYYAPVAASQACLELGFSHWIQSSTQAINSHRAGQVVYSRAKAMTDFSLTTMSDLNVTIAVLGLLYCKEDGLIGQRAGSDVINLIDLSLLPLTPIMGLGTAPLQPQEITDAAMRIAFLALTNPDSRPIQDVVSASRLANTLHPCENTKLRIYDAVGPETMSILTMLEVFAKYQGNFNFRPVHIGYKNMERILNVRSLGNLNRQFVSLLRSEQDSLAHPIIGYPDVWDSILPGDTGRMCTLDEAFSVNQELVKASSRMRFFGPRKRFPYWKVVNHIIHNPRVIPPGIDLSLEIIHSYLTNRKDGFA